MPDSDVKAKNAHWAAGSAQLRWIVGYQAELQQWKCALPEVGASRGSYREQLARVRLHSHDELRVKSRWKVLLLDRACTSERWSLWSIR
jgi:hypothetical protein